MDDEITRAEPNGVAWSDAGDSEQEGDRESSADTRTTRRNNFALLTPDASDEEIDAFIRHLNSDVEQAS